LIYVSYFYREKESVVEVPPTNELQDRLKSIEKMLRNYLVIYDDNVNDNEDCNKFLAEKDLSEGDMPCAVETNSVFYLAERLNSTFGSQEEFAQARILEVMEQYKLTQAEFLRQMQEKDEIEEALKIQKAENFQLKELLNHAKGIAGSREALGEKLQQALEEIAQLVKQYKLLNQSLVEATERNTSLANVIVTLKLQLEVSQTANLPNRDPPEGEVIFVSTSVQEHSKLWNDIPSDMTKAMRIYNTLIARAIDDNNGYPAGMDSGTHLVAFDSPIDAINFATDLQVQLLNCTWDQNLIANADCATEFAEDGKLLFNGLRMRTNIHCGEPTVDIDPDTKGTTYYGKVVNVTKSMARLPYGGQIIVSQDFMLALEYSTAVMEGEAHFTHEYKSKPLQFFFLPDTDKEMMIIQVLPVELIDRSFPEIKTDGPAEAALKQQLAQLEAENEALLNKLKDMAHDAQDASERADQLTVTIKALYAEFKQDSTAQERLDRALHDMDSLKEVHQTVRDEIVRVREENEHLKSSITGANERVKDIAEEMKKLMTKRVTELENQRDSVGQKLVETTTKYEKLKDACFEIEKENSIILKNLGKKQESLSSIVLKYNQLFKSMNDIIDDYSSRLMALSTEQTAVIPNSQ